MLSSLLVPGNESSPSRISTGRVTGGLRLKSPIGCVSVIVMSGEIRKLPYENWKSLYVNKN